MYILDLTKTDEAYGNHSLAIVKLTKLGVHSVPNPFCIKPDLFAYYLTHKDFPDGFLEELQSVYAIITNHGYTANVRTPDIDCPSHPDLSYSVRNSMFIPSFEGFCQALKDRLQAITKTVEQEQITDITVSFLIQSTYDSHQCGIGQTDDGYGNVRIEAAFGQTTNIFSRDDIDPDIYIVTKDTLQIKTKIIGTKTFEFSLIAGEMKKVPIPNDRQSQQVYPDEIIIAFAKDALLLEKAYGPQEFECAVTTKNDALIDALPIVQETRAMTVVKKETSVAGMTIIYPQEIEGEVYLANNIAELPEEIGTKIIITNNSDINYITMLAYKYKPKGVICTQGTITSHPSTILREARMPSYIATKIAVVNGDIIHIQKNGAITKM